MKIGIVGHGYVGQAIAWAHRQNELVIKDPKLPDSATYDQLLGCDAVFVCVPSPSTEDGRCDVSILEQVLKELMFTGLVKDIPIISKVTAPPSQYRRLQDLYPNLVHCPEFLTAANHIADYQNSDYFVVGGQEEYCAKAAVVLREGVPLVTEKILMTDIKTAALYKYMMNSYLAAKVTFMNDFKKLADAEDVNWHDLKSLTTYDDRIGYTHLDVPGPDGKYGWAGACFPKDVAAIITEAIDLGVDFELMDRVESINRKHRGL